MDWKDKVGAAFWKDGVVWFLESYRDKPSLVFRKADSNEQLVGEVGSSNCLGFQQLAPVDERGNPKTLTNPHPCEECHEDPSMVREANGDFEIWCGNHPSRRAKSTSLSGVVALWNEKNDMPF